MEIMRTPRALQLSITSECNQRCLYCAHFTSPNDTGSELPVEEWLRFFAELKRCRVLNVTITGGEPLLYPDFQRLVLGIVENKMRFGLLTNGTLMTNEIAAFLAGTRRCDFVRVSIDGERAEMHDIARGEGNFVKALNGIKILLENKIPTMGAITINRYNVWELAETIEFLLGELQLVSITAGATDYFGMCCQDSENLQLTPAEESFVLETLLQKVKKYGNRIVSSSGFLVKGNSWMAMEKARRIGEFQNKGGFLCGCSGPTLAVRPDGVIIPCPSYNHLELGRINGVDLAELWQRHSVLDEFRQRRNIPLHNSPECQDCPYLSECSGGCPAMSYAEAGNPDYPTPSMCLRKFLASSGKLPEAFLTTKS